MSITYDFEEAFLLKETDKKNGTKEWTNVELAKRYGYASHSGFTRKYNRDLGFVKQAVTKQYKPKQKTPEKDPQNFSIKKGINRKYSVHDFATEICGYDWDKEYITEMRDFQMETFTKQLERIILEPRDTGKTNTSISVSAYIIAEYTLPQLTITGHGLKDILFDEIRNIVESPPFINRYGSPIAKFNSIKGDMKLFPEYRQPRWKDPTLSIKGRGSWIVGRHPRITWFEDIIQEPFRSDESNQKLERWYNRVVKYLGQAKGGTGTRKDPDDFYNFLFKKKNFTYLKRSALKLLSGKYPEWNDIQYETIVIGEDEQQQITGIPMDYGKYWFLDCPNFTLERLLIERADDPIGFEAEKNNNPISETGFYFKNTMYIERDYIDLDYGSRNAYVITDPAFGKSKSASDSVVQVWGILNNTYILRDMLVGKYGTTGFSENVIDMSDDYQARETHLEDNFAQITTRFDDESELMKIPGVQVFESKGNKHDRIMAMLGPFSRHKILVDSRCRFKDKLREQMMNYAPHKKGSWDILDCTSTAIERLSNKIRKSGIKGKVDMSGKKLSFNGN